MLSDVWDLSVPTLDYRFDHLTIRIIIIIIIIIIILLLLIMLLLLLMLCVCVCVRQKSSVGQDLVNAVSEHLNLAEKDYFSCSYKDSHGVRVSSRRFTCLTFCYPRWRGFYRKIRRLSRSISQKLRCRGTLSTVMFISKRRGTSFISMRIKIKYKYVQCNSYPYWICTKIQKVSITSDAMWAELANCRHENFVRQCYELLA